MSWGETGKDNGMSWFHVKIGHEVEKNENQKRNNETYSQEN